jgi:carbon monoxide dehydrogenase subunit G
MAIQVEERFTVRAPAAAVWAYLTDPRRVVSCLPGAELVEVVDERTFLGNVRVKVGALGITYKGRVHLDELDTTTHRVKMSGEGRESAGTGQARMTMESEVTERGPSETEVVVRAQVDVVGRIVQLGRGMIVEVAHQLFQQLATCVAATLGAEAASSTPAGAAGAPATPPPRADAVRAVPLLLAAFWAWLRSLFGRPRTPRARRV